MRYKNKNNLKRDVKLLYELYQGRVLTIDQLTSRFTYKKSYMYKLVSNLFKSGLILTGDIKGFTNESGIRGRYYRISNKGIKLLKENGYPDLKYDAEDLKVSDVRVPIEILFNDVHYEMTKHGWQVYGSRESKEKYGINRTDNLCGVLSSPVFNREYPFYIFQFQFEMSDEYCRRFLPGLQFFVPLFAFKCTSPCGTVYHCIEKGMNPSGYSCLC